MISDFSRNPLWQKEMPTCEWLTEPPLAVGSRYRRQARFLDEDVVTTFEVTDLDPDHPTKSPSTPSMAPSQ